MGAQSGEGRDDLAQRHVLHGKGRLGGHVMQAFRRCVNGFLVLDVGGRGTYDEVAMDGWRYEHALAHGSGEHKDGVIHVVAGGGVEQVVLALTRNDGELVVRCRHLVVDEVGIDAGSIHNGLGVEGLLPCRHGPGIAFAGNLGYGRVETELHAIGGGVLRERYREAERVNDAARGGPKRAHGFVCDVGLHGNKLRAINDAQVRHAVGLATSTQHLKAVHIGFAHAYHERTIVYDGEVELLCPFVHQAVALDVEHRHERFRLRVKARVHDGGVCL